MYNFGTDLPSFLDVARMRHGQWSTYRSRNLFDRTSNLADQFAWSHQGPTCPSLLSNTPASRAA